MEEKRQSSCGAVRCHTLHTAHLGYWFPEGSHVPRSEEDSCNLLHDKHPQSDSPTTMKARLRICAGQAPSDSSQVHNEQCVRSKLAQPMVEPILHFVQDTVGCIVDMRISLDLGNLVCPGNHHVGSGCSKGVRSYRRFLNPDSKELEPHFSVRFLGAEDVAIDDQLQSFIVDLQTLIAIPVTCCCLSDSPAVRRPQDIHPDQIVNLDPTAFIAFDDVMKCNAVSSIQGG